MAGVKGRSGRKSTTDEQRRQRVIDKAWEYIEFVLDDPNATMSQKSDIAKSIIVKNIPQELEHSGAIEGTKISINMVKVTNEGSQLRNNPAPIPSVAISNR